jgi:transposase-like protein
MKPIKQKIWYNEECPDCGSDDVEEYDYKELSPRNRRRLMHCNSCKSEFTLKSNRKDGGWYYEVLGALK